MSFIGQGLSVGLKPDKSGLKQTDKLKKCAFTIAEILITIGIVGVIAALTIPTLIQNSNSKKFTTQFKKSLSTLNQAAISAQAQYDMDYGALSSESDPSTCASDKFSSSQSTMCALLNSTLAAKSYLGVYGSVNGSKSGTTYSFTKTTEGFDPTNFLIYSMADGSLVGFNPKMRGCSLSTQLTKSVLTDENGLKNCIGFIDVNGVSLPNKEVTCNDGTSALEPNNPCTLKSSAKGMGDIFPVVFHNGTVEPATNASKAFFSGEKSDTTTEETSTTPTTTPSGYKIGKRDDPTTWEPFVPTTPMSKADCEELIGDEYGIKGCNFNDDYWAAAVKECGGVQNMLTDDDLTKLAQSLYPSCSGTSCSGDIKTSEIPSNLSGLGSSWYTLWSGSEDSDDGASIRNFISSVSYRGYNFRNGSFIRAVCVGD